MKYVYPAVFTREEDGKYSVVFNDLDGCYTCGDDLADALYMAEDALALTLYDYEEEGKPVPTASECASAVIGENEFVNYVRCDTDVYRRKNNSRAVKKTLSIPEWLNEQATEAGINFSQVLQEALKEKLDIA